MYMTSTRPDIMFVVSLVARFMHQPHESHWRQSKRILKYVSGTKFYELFYTFANDSNVVAYTDVDLKETWMIERVPLDMLFSLEETLFLGAEKSNPLLHYLQQKQNILLHHQQAHKPFGCQGSRKTWEWKYANPSEFTVIIKLLSPWQRIQFSIAGANILTFSITSLESLSNKNFSFLNFVNLKIILQTYLLPKDRLEILRS